MIKLKTRGFGRAHGPDVQTSRPAGQQAASQLARWPAAGWLAGRPAPAGQLAGRPAGWSIATTNQEEETRKLLKYCDLEWDENCLSFHENERAVKTASALQVRKKMYQGSSEAWKKYESYLEPLLKGLKSY